LIRHLISIISISQIWAAWAQDRIWIQNALTLKILQVYALQALGAQQGILSG
jgi:hypothetical protein